MHPEEKRGGLTFIRQRQDDLILLGSEKRPHGVVAVGGVIYVVAGFVFEPYRFKNDSHQAVRHTSLCVSTNLCLKLNFFSHLLCPYVLRSAYG